MTKNPDDSLIVEEEFEAEAEVCSLPGGFEAEFVLGRLVTAPPGWALERADIREMLQSRPGRLRFALTGGVAGGKSSIADIFVKLGAGHIDFDQLARQAVAPGSQGLHKVLELLGPDFADSEGQLDRPKTARAIFSDPEKKAALESILHPITWDLLGAELRAQESAPALAISVPLLFEAGLESFFSPIVMVFASAEVQRRRLRLRNPGLSPEQAEEIISSQWPSPPKVMGSTYIINNNGSLEDSAKQVEMVWRAMLDAEM